MTLVVDDDDDVVVVVAAAAAAATGDAAPASLGALPLPLALARRFASKVVAFAAESPSRGDESCDDSALP